MTSACVVKFTSEEKQFMTANKTKMLKILNSWRVEGKNEAPTAPGIPSHPEFIYRLPEFGSSWKGWNDLLGVNKNSESESYEKNLKQDIIDEISFKIYVKIGSPSHWWK
tara:strand:+ start:1505 stop:1831 length:327 start_codon:yes stop_codon:yes gene_type:complete